MSFLRELKRRNVLRFGAAYIAVSWLVVQVAETLFPLFGMDESAARNVVVVLAIGLVPALVFAWVFEVTPEGLRKENEVQRGESITARTGRRLDRFIIIALALAITYFAVDKFVLSPQRESVQARLQAEQLATATEQAREQGRIDALVEAFGERSIAVLPFVDMSPGEDQEYFSDGISEELLNLLARVPELRVISRTSAFSYKNRDVKVTEVAEELDVNHVLEGSVRISGDRVRITAQLIDARSDSHIWSENYDRTLDDIFGIQDEIAAAVVERLKVTLSTTPSR